MHSNMTSLLARNIPATWIFLINWTTILTSVDFRILTIWMWSTLESLAVSLLKARPIDIFGTTCVQIAYEELEVTIMVGVNLNHHIHNLTFGISSHKWNLRIWHERSTNHVVIISLRVTTETGASGRSAIVADRIVSFPASSREILLNISNTATVKTMRAGIDYIIWGMTNSWTTTSLTRSTTLARCAHESVPVCKEQKGRKEGQWEKKYPHRVCLRKESCTEKNTLKKSTKVKSLLTRVSNVEERAMLKGRFELSTTAYILRESIQLVRFPSSSLGLCCNRRIYSCQRWHVIVQLIFTQLFLSFCAMSLWKLYFIAPFRQEVFWKKGCLSRMKTLDTKTFIVLYFLRYRISSVNNSSIITAISYFCSVSYEHGDVLVRNTLRTI